jgi:L-2,4-diaminobutyrate transaminase
MLCPRSYLTSPFKRKGRTETTGIRSGNEESIRSAQLDELDVRYAFHPFTSAREHQTTGPLIIVEGHGCRLYDSSGNSYLDAMAGLWCVNIGYGNLKMANAMKVQVERLSYYHSFASMATDVSKLLAQRLVETAAVPMFKVFFGNSGSDANDTQIKLVWYYNNVLGRSKKKIHLTPARLSRRDGPHRGVDGSGESS